MKNLVIDQGNTACKLAVFEAGDLTERLTSPVLDKAVLKSIFKNHPGIGSAILSSVSEYDREVPLFLSENLDNLVILGSQTPLPIINKYASRETLGYDRIADAVGAFTLFPGSDVLVVDAGTAITIDLLTADGVFKGGNISPGLDLRFRALHEFTRKLPRLEKKEISHLLGTTTGDAILGGVINGAVFEIDGYIEKLLPEYPDLKIILTGGDINYFDKKLKNSIFANSNLNLIGLNRILEYNVKTI